MLFVAKQYGKLRLILDCRRTNLLFRSPPRTVLGSIESWSRVRLGEKTSTNLEPECPGTEVHEKGAPPDGTMFVSQEDVRDCFYRLGIDPELGAYFGLPEADPIVLKEVFGGVLPDEVLGLILEGSPLVPNMAVLPMGFSWAFHWAHESLVELAHRSHGDVPQIVDKKVCPELSHDQAALLIYADNGNHVGLDPDTVNESRMRLSETVNSVGLKTHEMVPATSSGVSLGICFDGFFGVVQTTPERDQHLPSSHD